MLTVAVPKRNKLPNIIVLTPKDGVFPLQIRSNRSLTRRMWRWEQRWLLIVRRIWEQGKRTGFVPDSEAEHGLV